MIFKILITKSSLTDPTNIQPLETFTQTTLTPHDPLTSAQITKADRMKTKSKIKVITQLTAIVEKNIIESNGVKKLITGILSAVWNNRWNRV